MRAWRVFGCFGINVVATLLRHVTLFHWILKVGDLTDHVVKSWKMRFMKYPRWFCVLSRFRDVNQLKFVDRPGTGIDMNLASRAYMLVFATLKFMQPECTTRNSCARI